MREIKLPRIVDKDGPGWGVVIPVQVDWPEVQLTEQQAFENMMARACGAMPPHEDHSFINVVLTRGTEV